MIFVCKKLSYIAWNSYTRNILQNVIVEIMFDIGIICSQFSFFLSVLFMILGIAAKFRF